MLLVDVCSGGGVLLWLLFKEVSVMLYFI